MEINITNLCDGEKTVGDPTDDCGHDKPIAPVSPWKLRRRGWLPIRTSAGSLVRAVAASSCSQWSWTHHLLSTARRISRVL